MGIIQSLLTLCGIGIVGLLFVLFCHRFLGWTWTTHYLLGSTSTQEEKMVLTKLDNNNSKGCLIPSSDSSELALSGRGSFRHFDKTDQDYTLLRQTSSSSLISNSRSTGSSSITTSSAIPPQPLRPAPIPPITAIIGSSVFGSVPNSPGPSHTSITIPHSNGNSAATPTTTASSTARSSGGGGGADPSSTSFSNNNPFLPLLQASTQFFTQKFQSFQQPFSQNNGSSGINTFTIAETPKVVAVQQRQSNDINRVNSLNESSVSHHHSVQVPVPDQNTTNTNGGTKPRLSMGEILFSSPPAHSILPDKIQQQSHQQESKHIASETTSQQKWANSKSDSEVKMVGLVKRQSISLAHLHGGGDSRQHFSINADLLEGKSDRDEGRRSSVPRELENSFFQNHPTPNSRQPNLSSASSVDGDVYGDLKLKQAQNNNSHIILKKQQPNTFASISASLLSEVDTTTNTSIAAAKPELHPHTHNSTTSPSPTRSRDRQRKMELTLQHIQNNQYNQHEDRISLSLSSSSSSNVKMKHHNVDSHYPMSTPYVPGGGIGGCGDSSCMKSNRFHRSPHLIRSPIVPPLKEADELAFINEQSSPPSQPPPAAQPHLGMDSFSHHPDKLNTNSTTSNFTSTFQQQPIKNYSHRPSSLIEQCCDELTCNKWILETMREEIRLENERMEDATKSLMMEEDFTSSSSSFRRKSKNEVVGMAAEEKQEVKKVEESSCETLKSLSFSSNTTKSHDLDKLNNTEPPSASTLKEEEKVKASEVESKDNMKIFYANSNGEMGNQQQQSSPHVKTNFIPTEINPTGVSATFSQDGSAVTEMLRNRQGGGGGEKTTFSSSNNGNDGKYCGGYTRPILGERAHSYSSSSSGTCLATPPFRNTRSFSLRQSSTDSVDGGSDGGSLVDLSLPSLQRALSCDSVSSDTSVVLGDLHPTGFLCIGLEYDCETADLLVNVMEAKDLVGPDSNSYSFDSYVRVYMLPDKTTNMQTRVYRKSLNPVYREKFMFGVETIELPLRTLVFYLYATDKYSNTLIGETEIKLGDLDIYQPITTWLQLTDTGQKGGESGEIMFSLSYLPTAERLTVVVVKARNLKFPHERETGDPFVKVYLLQKGKKVSKKKSSTKKGEKNPIFNEAMIFSVPAHALQTIQLRITVADTSELEGRANSVGHVIVGSSASGKSLSHWNQMLSSLRKPIAMWHPLRK